MSSAHAEWLVPLFAVAPKTIQAIHFWTCHSQWDYFNTLMAQPMVCLFNCVWRTDPAAVIQPKLEKSFSHGNISLSSPVRMEVTMTRLQQLLVNAGNKLLEKLEDSNLSGCVFLRFFPSWVTCDHRLCSFLSLLSSLSAAHGGSSCCCFCFVWKITDIKNMSRLQKINTTKCNPWCLHANSEAVLCHKTLWELWMFPSRSHQRLSTDFWMKNSRFAARAASCATGSADLKVWIMHQTGLLTS